MKDKDKAPAEVTSAVAPVEAPVVAPVWVDEIAAAEAQGFRAQVTIGGHLRVDL